MAACSERASVAASPWEISPLPAAGRCGTGGPWARLGLALAAGLLGAAAFAGAQTWRGLIGSDGDSGPAARQLQFLTNQPQPSEDEQADKMRQAEDAQQLDKMTFYIYRAQDYKDHSLSNVNGGDIAGVFWYLHNEVVLATPRKNNISRIVRYKVSIMNDYQYWSQSGKLFAQYAVFQSGKCVVPNCDAMWTFGYNVGCQSLNSSLAAYLSPFATMESENNCRGNCYDGLWFSFPGSCPLSAFPSKSQECKLSEPGGRCEHENDLFSVEKKCTYYAEQAGEASLDELVGISNYTNWWLVLGNHEYISYQDSGSGTDFWDGKHDPRKCQWRMDKLQWIFRTKYPDMPMTYGMPPCDAAYHEM